MATNRTNPEVSNPFTVEVERPRFVVARVVLDFVQWLELGHVAPFALEAPAVGNANWMRYPDPMNVPPPCCMGS